MSANDCTAPIVYREIPSLPGFRFGEDGSSLKLGMGGRGSRIPAGTWSPISVSRRDTGFSWLAIGPRKTTKPRRIDELVCEAFHGPRPTGTECIHKDGDRGNYRADNLEWGVMANNVMSPLTEYRDWHYTPGYRYGADGSVWSSWGPGNDAPGDVWRRMNPTTLDSGHLQIHVKTTDGDRKYGVHHLLANVFYGPPTDGMECCHEDGVPSNNAASNLRWGTRKSNAEDSVKHGVIARGEDNHLSKFTNDQVVDFRARYARGDASMSELAEIAGVSVASVSQMIRGNTWSHLPGAIPLKEDDRRFSPDAVRLIRKQYETEGYTQYELAKKHDVTPGAIYELLARRTWGHIE